MESANETPTFDQIADLVVQNLKQSGVLANLGQASLMTIKDETLDNIHRIARRMNILPRWQVRCPANGWRNRQPERVLLGLYASVETMSGQSIF